MIRKTAIIGMGALGMLYGEHIARAAGKDSVTYILDDERYESYGSRTFTCNRRKMEPVFGRSSCQTPYDLVIVAVKYTSLSSALETMRNCIGPDTIILSVLNGISSEKIIGARYGMEKMLITIAQGMDAVRSSSGKDSVLTYTKQGLLFIGKPDSHGDTSLDARFSRNLGDVKEYFDSIQMPYKIEDNINYRLWAKWMLNVGINQTCAVFDTDYGHSVVPGKIMDTFVGAMKEVVTLSKLEGVNLADGEVESYVELIKTLDPGKYPSMEQDRKARRLSEVEMFAGTVIELAARHSLEVPVNRFLYDEMKKIEAAY